MRDPYIEISKYKFTKQFKSLIAMKRIILILLAAALSLSLASAQDQTVTQGFYPTKSGVDSIVVYKIDIDIPQSVFRPITRRAFYNVVKSGVVEVLESTGQLYNRECEAKYEGGKICHEFEEYGTYAILSYKDGELLPVTYTLIDKKWAKHSRLPHPLKYVRAVGVRA